MISPKNIIKSSILAALIAVSGYMAVTAYALEDPPNFGDAVTCTNGAMSADESLICNNNAWVFCGSNSQAQVQGKACIDGTWKTPAAPQACNTWTYSAWETCTAGNQTRTVLTSAPTGCIGGTPVLTQACISTCNTWTYSDWSACSGGNQTRTVLTSGPAGCSGGSPALTQICNNTTCNTWTYSDWGTCANGNQARTVLTSSPASCTGGTPVLTQACS